MKKGVMGPLLTTEEVGVIITSSNIINTISSFKSIITNIVGSFSSVQQMLKITSLHTKLITKPKELKNTESKRCCLIPVAGLAKVYSLR